MTISRLVFMSACIFSASCTTVSIAEPKEAATPGSVKSLNFALVDMQRTILTVEEGKKARTELEKKIKRKEEELMAKQKELDKLNEDWKKQAHMMSEEAKTRKQKEFQDKVMDLRKFEMSYREELKKEEGQATQKIAMKVAKMVDRIAKEKNLEIVFEANSSGLLYVKDPIDLTEQIIKEYETFSIANSDKVTK
jgi:outer membrane protein